MLSLVAKKYEIHGGYTLLLEAKWALDFVRQKFDWAMREHIGDVFRQLLRKGQRQSLKDFVAVCKNNLSEAKYAIIRTYLFGEALQLSLITRLARVLSLTFDIYNHERERQLSELYAAYQRAPTGEPPIITDPRINADKSTYVTT